MSTNQSASFFASTLPGRFYYDPEVYAQEMASIFSCMWICVGHIAAFPDPGSYQAVTVGQESVIVLRDQDGIFRAFYNVCRHRGARICMESSGRLKGSLQCPYHAWTYGLDGQLIGAPHVFKKEQFNKGTFSLLPIALNIWEGLIWINLSNDPPPLEAQMEETVRRGLCNYVPLARYHLGDLRIGKSISYEVKANWKILMENALECYHCELVHSHLCHMLPGLHHEQAVINDVLFLADGIEALTVTGKASRPPLAGLYPEDARRVYATVLLPNVFLTLCHDHVVFFTLSPRGPVDTSIVVHWLFDAQAVTSPDFDPIDTVAVTELINQQDWEVCERTQMSMASKAFVSGGVYVHIERPLRSFCDFVLEKSRHQEEQKLTSMEKSIQG